MYIHIKLKLQLDDLVSFSVLADYHMIIIINVDIWEA